MTSCSMLNGTNGFGGTCSIHINFINMNFTLKMEAIYLSEMLTSSTRRRILATHNLFMSYYEYSRQSSISLKLILQEDFCFVFRSVTKSTFSFKHLPDSTLPFIESDEIFVISFSLTSRRMLMLTNYRDKQRRNGTKEPKLR